MAANEQIKRVNLMRCSECRSDVRLGISESGAVVSFCECFRIFGDNIPEEIPPYWVTTQDV